MNTRKSNLDSNLCITSVEKVFSKTNLMSFTDICFNGIIVFAFSGVGRLIADCNNNSLVLPMWHIGE